MHTCTETATEYGTTVCILCGVEKWGNAWSDRNYNHSGAPMSGGVYTRQKRFKKYLNRASKQQSSTCVPDLIWKYLISKKPFQGPKDIIRTLKRMKHVKAKKCYDCLPLLTSVLCPHLSVPTLTEHEVCYASRLFRNVDYAYSLGEPLISYMFVLEYLLEYIGRSDILPFINKIKCKKRRVTYHHRMNNIIQNDRQTVGIPVAQVSLKPVAKICYTPAPSVLDKVAAPGRTQQLDESGALQLLVELAARQLD